MPATMLARKILVQMGFALITASFLVALVEAFGHGRPLGHLHLLKHKPSLETFTTSARSITPRKTTHYTAEENSGYQLGRRDSADYTVAAGDTLSSIAATYSITNGFLSSSNPTIDCKNLALGQILQMPSLRAPISYTIASGDTGDAIASNYSISFVDLEAAAPSVNWTSLQIGQVLQVPGYGTPTTYNPIAGDNGYSISAGFQITFSCLQSANPEVNWFNLQPGSTVLQIPAGPSPSDCNCTGNPTATTGPPITTNSATSTVTLSATGLDSTSAPALSSAAPTTYTPSSSMSTSSDLSSDTSPSGSATTVPISVTPAPSASSSGAPELTSAAGTTASTSMNQPPLTATGIVAGGNAVLTPNNQNGQSASPSYTMYTGDGTKWPQISEWASFDSMWSTVKATIGQNCAQNAASNTPDETQDLYNAIQYVAGASHVDDRFILAIIENESNGCVRVPSTTYTITNPGLMQSHAGSGSCNNDSAVLNPCPYDTIVQMVQDGAMGTPSGAGLAQLINQLDPLTGSLAFYRAARMYNAGSVPPSMDLGALGATPCYASDIANRLMGWNGIGSTCTTNLVEEGS